MRDINAFRERYKYWKETGELPYKAGRVIEQAEGNLPLPTYAGGKNDDDWLLNFVADREGYRKNVYNDTLANNIETIGYGFTDPAVINKYRRTGMSETVAKQILRTELNKRKIKLQQLVPHWNELTPNMQDSLTSYYYNFPFHNDPNSKAKRHYSPKLFKALENRDWQEVARQMDGGINQAKGLRNRRIAEQQHFLGNMSLKRPSKTFTQPSLIQELEEQEKWQPNVEYPTQTQYEISQRVPQSISSWSSANSPAPFTRMPDLINIMDAYRNFIDDELPLNRPKFNDGKSKKLDVTETNVFDRVLDNNGDNLEWAYRKNWGNKANKKLFKAAYGNTEYMNVGEHKLPIYGSGPTWYTFDAGQLPEVIIQPDNDTDIARLKMKNIVPNKELRHDILEMEDLNTDYGAINKLYDIWVASNRPKVMNGDILDPILQPIMSRGGYREHYNPLFNTIHLDEYWPSLLAELSHAYQYNAKELEHKPSFFNIPGDIKINGKDGYSRPGHMEYQAHSVIEPLLEDYINGNIHSLNEVNAAINAEKVNRSFNVNKRYISKGPNKGRHFKKVNVFKKK